MEMVQTNLLEQQLSLPEQENTETQGYSIVNPVSGEFVTQGASLEDHIALLAEIEKDEQMLKDQKALLQAVIMQRMAENDQTLFEGAVFRAEIKPPTTDYSYSNDIFLLLNEGLVRQDEWDAVHTEEVKHKFNRIQLKKLLKKGGRIKEIIESSTVVTPKGAPKLAYSRLPGFVAEFASPDMEAKNLRTGK